ncbi:LAME_0F04764g1_1 [Lachancea meyersii CBS 8951]|uniref:LAME_0F04764g1_1 n=1 Tax=Lachancea meyersii CBS 8951 TaxID=1266667 RepID=A0A1G4JS70_9SACH|nr:LAME_0F04764g1_1 [Lachancea meyersii CBS 8951]
MPSSINLTELQTKKFRSPSTFFKSYINISSATGHLRSKLGVEERQRLEKIRLLKKENCALESAIKILGSYEKEREVFSLIDKWRSICQAGMAYLLNSTMLKISRMGGYEELVKKEIEAEKRKLEYQFSDQIESGIDDILESDEFKMMSDLDQAELKHQLYQKKEEADKAQQVEIEKLDAKVKESSGAEFTMQNLARRLKVDYDMIFQS